MKLYKHYKDNRMTTLATCDAYAQHEFKKTLLGVISYASPFRVPKVNSRSKKAYYVFGRRVL